MSFSVNLIFFMKHLILLFSLLALSFSHTAQTPEVVDVASAIFIQTSLAEVGGQPAISYTENLNFFY